MGIAAIKTPEQVAEYEYLDREIRDIAKRITRLADRIDAAKCPEARTLDVILSIARKTLDTYTTPELMVVAAKLKPAPETED